MEEPHPDSLRKGEDIDSPRPPRAGGPGGLGPSPPLRLLRHTAGLAGAQVATRAILFGFGIVAARVLGEQGFGAYATLYVYLSLAVVLSDFGLGRLLTRDAAQRPGESARHGGQILALRLGLAAVGATSFLGFLAGAPAGGSGFTTVPAWALAGFSLAIPLSGYTLTAEALCVAHGRIRVVASGQLLLHLLNAGLGLGLLAAGQGVAGLLLAWVAALALQALFYTRAVAQLGGLRVWPLAGAHLRAILQAAWPYALVGLLAAVYFRIDTALLFWLQGEAAAGRYAATYRLLEGASFLPLAVVTVTLPAFARTLAGYPEGATLAAALLVRASRWLALLTLPLALFVSFYAAEVVTLLLGDAYRDAAPALALLLWALVPLALSAPTQAALSASTHLRRFLPWALANTLLNVALNLAWIPPWSATGAAATTLATELSGLALNLWVLQHWLKLDLRAWPAAVGRALLAAAPLLPLGAALRWAGWGLGPAALIWLLAAPLAAALTRAVRPDELARLSARRRPRAPHAS